MSTAEIRTIDSVYMIEFERVLDPRGFRVKDLSGDTAPHTYTPPHSARLYYYTAYGVWRYCVGSGNWEFSDDKESERNYRPAIIRECGIPLCDDMEDAAMYALKSEQTTEKEVEQAIDWHKMMKEGEKKMKEGLDKHYFDLPLVPAKRRRQGIITNITEGGNKMTKRLYHVILFNKKTEEIVFKQYIPANCETDASMMAAQAYGKYDSDVHVVVVKYIEGSDYAVE